MTERQSAPRPTQRTIAEQAGLSVGTVSRALADDPMIAGETRTLVRRIAEEIGYAPDRAALRLRTGRTHVISLILPPHEEIPGFGTALIRGISASLNDTPYHLVVMPDFGLEQSDFMIRRVVRNGLADGILFSRTQPDDPRIRFLLEADFPFVSHGRSELATPHPYVDYDNFEFARRAAKLLVDKGVQRLAIMLPPRWLTFSQHLRHGFMTAVRESGMQYEIIEGATLDSPSEAIKVTIQRRYGEPSPPDGLILPGEMSGLAALAAIQDLGLVPGRDVHFVVKQASGIFGLVRPKVDSLYEDLAEAGETMAALLLRRIAGEPASALHYLQPVGAPPASA